MDTLADLTERGFSLRIESERLVVSPAEKLTDTDRTRIRQHKPALVDALTPRRLWIITKSDGARSSSSFCPRVTLSELRALHPDALSVVPEIEPAPTRPLDPADEAAVRSWLDSINEHDPQIITEVLTKCAADPRALACLLRRADEVVQ